MVTYGGRETLGQKRLLCQLGLIPVGDDGAQLYDQNNALGYVTYHLSTMLTEMKRWHKEKQ